MENKSKYPRYRIIENSIGSIWNYTVQKRIMWPLPFWFDIDHCDRIDTTHVYIANDKSTSKVVHIE